ncbi:MAG: hypothetical protein ACREUG_17625, partial [Steroidobacteraceae bacterium]
LNLLGLATPDARLPALTGNRVLYRDGLPIAALWGGEVQYLQALDPTVQWEARNAVLRCGPMPNPPAPAFSGQPD